VQSADGEALRVVTAAALASQRIEEVVLFVGLRDFARITVEEFGAYAAFRDFLRLRLLDLDEALDDVQSEIEMIKIGLEINDQVRAMASEMDKVRRKRAVATTGAVVGMTGTILIAVYGQALAAAVAAVGATGGIWGLVNATAENSRKPLRENKWYYVWALIDARDRSLPGL
jgi:hypothetical protein